MAEVTFSLEYPPLHLQNVASHPQGGYSAADDRSLVAATLTAGVVVPSSVEMTSDNSSFRVSRTGTQAVVQPGLAVVKASDHARSAYLVRSEEATSVELSSFGSTTIRIYVRVNDAAISGAENNAQLVASDIELLNDEVLLATLEKSGDTVSDPVDSRTAAEPLRSGVDLSANNTWTGTNNFTQRIGAVGGLTAAGTAILSSLQATTGTFLGVVDARGGIRLRAPNLMSWSSEMADTVMPSTTTISRTSPHRTNAPTVSFVVPPSGQVFITIHAQGTGGGAGNTNYCGFEILDGSAVIKAFANNESITCGMQVRNFTFELSLPYQFNSRAGRTLTARMAFWNASANAFTWTAKRIIVRPV